MAGFDFDFLVGIYPALLQATLVTLALTGVSLIAGFGIGFFTGWARVSPRFWIRAASTAYVEVVRGTPLVVQIFVIYSMFPALLPDARVPAFWRIALALTINTGAYQGEIFRGGFQSISTGQVEAARSLGMTYWQAMGHVIAPQTLRIVTPSLLNEFIIMLQSSALGSVIGFKELTGKAMELAARGGDYLEALVGAATIYIAITVSMSAVIHVVERRYRVPGLGVRPHTTA